MDGDQNQRYCLKWCNHQSTLISAIGALFDNGLLVDCTLAAEGQFFKAHKVVLSACSPYFANLLKEQNDKHHIFILKDVKYEELRALMDYIYRGKVNITQDQLFGVLQAAKSLQIKGLSCTTLPPKPQEYPIKFSSITKLEQTKRACLDASAFKTQDINPEGSSSSTSNLERKKRRSSIKNVMDNHEHSNYSPHSIQQRKISPPLLITSHQRLSQQNKGINEKKDKTAIKKVNIAGGLFLKPDLTEDQKNELIDKSMNQTGGLNHQNGEHSNHGISTNCPTERSQDELYSQETKLNRSESQDTPVRSATPKNGQDAGNQLATQQKTVQGTQQKQQKSQQQQQQSYQRSATPFSFQQQRSSNPYLSQQHHNSPHQQSSNYSLHQLQSKYAPASPAYNPNCSPYYHNGYPYSNGSSGSNWSSPYSSPSYSWSPHHQQQSPQHRYHFSPPLTKLPGRKRSFSPISSNSSASLKLQSNKIHSNESESTSNKKSKRKTKSEPIVSNNKTNEIKSEIKALDLKPLPGFQQAFGSTEIGRFSEVFLSTPSSVNDNYYEYESEADTNASPYPWETGDSLEGPHYNLHIGASVQSIYSNSSDKYGSSSIDSPLDNNYFREIRCNDY